jgi:hypothetical protein
VRSASLLIPPESAISTTPGSARLCLGLTLSDSGGDRFGSSHCLIGWLAYFVDQALHVLVHSLQQDLPLDLGSYGFLKQFGGGQGSLLELAVQIVGQINLQPRHTPNYTLAST